jgi:hypothetical protein
MDPVAQWINSLGFPIAAFLLMFHLVTSTLKEITQGIAAMNTTLQELREAVRKLAEGKGTASG